MFTGTPAGAESTDHAILETTPSESVALPVTETLVLLGGKAKDIDTSGPALTTGGRLAGGAEVILYWIW